MKNELENSDDSRYVYSRSSPYLTRVAMLACMGSKTHILEWLTP
jgi:hypothetical protein